MTRKVPQLVRHDWPHLVPVSSRFPVNAGASGGQGAALDLLKDRLLDAHTLDDALRRIAAGETVIDAELVRVLLQSSSRASPLAILSTREKQVLGLIAQGLSDRGIAERLVISLNTVGTHIQRIFAKLGLPDTANDNRRVHAALTWLHNPTERHRLEW